MIELRHLRSLIAIAELSKLAAAAERVHLTQSALSHQVKGLENHYGLSLFERSKQGLRFTPAGTRLLELARTLVAQVSEAERDVARLKGDTSGELRIVLECHTCFDWLMPVMDEFRRRWSEVEVDLVAGFHADPLALLRDGRADVVIGSRPPARRGWQVAPLFQLETLA
jgi:LysR family transcriptional regulator, regulator for metE and metH